MTKSINLFLSTCTLRIQPITIQDISQHTTRRDEKPLAYIDLIDVAVVLTSSPWEVCASFMKQNEQGSKEGEATSWAEQKP